MGRSEFYFRCADTIVAICPLYARFFADYNEAFPVGICRRKRIWQPFYTFTMVKYGQKWVGLICTFGVQIRLKLYARCIRDFVLITTSHFRLESVTGNRFGNHFAYSQW